MRVALLLPIALLVMALPSLPANFAAAQERPGFEHAMPSEAAPRETPGPLFWIFWVLRSIFYFLFFTFWGWIILLAVGVPAVQKRLRTWRRRRSLYQAREAELANPRNAGARFQLGVIHYEGRQLRRALRYFKEAVGIGEAHGLHVDPKLYQYLGHTLRRLGHYREAIISYEAGLEEAPESGRGESETGLGLARQKLGEPEAAEAWYRLATERNHSLIEPRVRLAALLLRRERVDEARAVLEDARSIRLPDFMRRSQRRWRLALALFPLTRHLV